MGQLVSTMACLHVCWSLLSVPNGLRKRVPSHFISQRSYFPPSHSVFAQLPSYQNRDRVIPHSVSRHTSTYSTRPKLKPVAFQNA